MKPIFLLPLFALALAACEDRAVDAQGQPVAIDPITGQPVIDGTASIEADHDKITLSNYSQEQQKIDRERYARELEAAASQRVVINEVYVPPVDTSVNPAAFARSTTNNVGEAMYARNGKKGNCRGYVNPEEAQRAFLQAGGPQVDTLGLDPDGDGFACDFNPTYYRMIN